MEIDTSNKTISSALCNYILDEVKAQNLNVFKYYGCEIEVPHYLLTLKGLSFMSTWKDDEETIKDIEIASVEVLDTDLNKTYNMAYHQIIALIDRLTFTTSYEHSGLGYFNK
jgi:hypothetical protein